jgi:plastocyanin
MFRTTHAVLSVSAIFLTAVAVVACGGDEPTPEPTPVPAIEVQASEFAFDPDQITISSEGSTTIRLVNGGIVEHDFTIDELDFQVAVPIGETAEGTLTDVAPGTYKFYCTVPGHEVNGMVGELVVTE